MSFTAHFPEDFVQPAERLSDGQQVVLAMSFLMAVNFAYADLGFLALDEPTANLDEHHIKAFAPAMQQLRLLAASRGLQCLMVTHERTLAPLFDSVIQL
jgi:DNA repair exonuclease SbcCD ATPase subunit